MLWILLAFGSAFFAGITAVLAKIGIAHINSTLATAVRTVVVLAFSWLMVFVAGSQNTIGQMTGSTLLFLILSGLSTGASWLCYFKALQLGDVNKVAPSTNPARCLLFCWPSSFWENRSPSLRSLACWALVSAPC